MQYRVGTTSTQYTWAPVDYLSQSDHTSQFHASDKKCSYIILERKMSHSFNPPFFFTVLGHSRKQTKNRPLERRNTLTWPYLSVSKQKFRATGTQPRRRPSQSLGYTTLILQCACRSQQDATGTQSRRRRFQSLGNTWLKLQSHYSDTINNNAQSAH